LVSACVTSTTNNFMFSSWLIIGITLLLQFFFYVAHRYKECMNSRINFTGIA
jgi:hypothetical protein